eukprot:3510226-Lingulodinium_polyedra.AAC.1
MRTGKTVQKRNILWLKLRYPEDWLNRTAQYIQTITRTDTASVDERPMTRGQLEQIHGVTETQELLERGFWQETMIKGIKHYIKCDFTKTTSVSKASAESVTLNKSVAKDELHQLEDAFQQFKATVDTDWKGTGAWPGTSAGGKSLGTHASSSSLAIEDVAGPSAGNKTAVAAKESALACLNKIQEVQNSIYGTTNALVDNPMARTIVKMMKKATPELEKHRRNVQKVATAATIDPKAVKAAIIAAVECCSASVTTLKTAHRFLSTS